VITFESETFDSLQCDVLDRMLQAAEFETEGVREDLGIMIRLKDPRARITTSLARNISYGPVVGTFIRYMTRDVTEAERRQAAINKLVKDESSRNAIVHQPGIANTHYFIRNNRLCSHVSMSCLDAIYGLTNSVFCFSLEQEIIMLHLREHYPQIDLGDMVFSLASLIMRDKHLELAEEVCSEPERPAGRMLPINSLVDIDAVAYDEAALREGRPVSGGGYAGGAAWLFDQLVEYKMQRDQAIAWSDKRPSLAV
jgi:hypothetical protein